MSSRQPRTTADVWVVLALVGTTGVAVFGDLWTPLRTLLVIPTLFLAPGYALTTLLFPTAAGTGVTGPGALSTVSDAALNHWERAGLAFGSSVALVPLLGLLVSLGTGDLSTPVVFGAVSTLTLLLLALGLVRRLRAPPSVRYRPPSLAALLGPVPREPPRDRVLSVLLATAVVVATAGVAVAVVAEPEPATYTEASLLTRAADGNLVASGYPSAMTQGEEREVVLRVANHEGVTVDYVLVQRWRDLLADPGSESRTSSPRLVREQVAPGDTWLYEHTVEPPPTMTGDRLAVEYFIYRGSAPAVPDRDSAYRFLSLSVAVTGTEETSA